jgi:hypothetical protein
MQYICFLINVMNAVYIDQVWSPTHHTSRIRLIMASFRSSNMGTFSPCTIKVETTIGLKKFDLTGLLSENRPFQVKGIVATRGSPKCFKIS